MRKRRLTLKRDNALHKIISAYIISTDDFSYDYDIDIKALVKRMSKRISTEDKILVSEAARYHRTKEQWLSVIKNLKGDSFKEEIVVRNIAKTVLKPSRTMKLKIGNIVKHKSLGIGIIVGFSSVSDNPDIFFYSKQQVVCVYYKEVRVVKK